MKIAFASVPRDTSASTELLLDGDDIVTTATRTAQRLGDSPEAVTVITADDILASGATTIPDLLRSVPGVDVMEPNPSQPNVAIRGFNTVFNNTVLVMVDGRRINEDVHSSVFWTVDPILLSRIKRIEIVRGPGSVLYGADAFSGVINIILKTPLECANETKEGTFIGSYENHNTNFAEATDTVSRKNDWAVTFGAGYHGTTGLYAGQPGSVPDSSSVPIYTLDAQKKTSRGSLLFSADDTSAKADISSEIVIPDGRFYINSFALSYNEDKGANPVTAKLYQSDLDISSGAFDANARDDEFDIQQQRPLGQQSSLTYGATYRTSSAKTVTTGPDTYNEHLGGVFLQDQDQIGPKTTLFGGVRDDDHSVYGTQISSRFSAVNHLSTNSTLRLSYGTAFSAPTLADNYLDFSSEVEGLTVNYVNNTSLRPEKIVSSEAGYRIEFPEGYAGLNIFYNNISDIIQTAVVSYAPPPYPAGIPTEVDFQNFGTAHASGFELESKFALTHIWSGLANYSYENVKAENGQTEDYSPDSKFNLTVESDQLRRVSGYLVGHYVSSSTSSGVSLRAYTTVDARIAYRLGASQGAWTASLASTNLLDDHHEEFVDVSGVGEQIPIGESSERSIRIELNGRF